MAEDLCLKDEEDKLLDELAALDETDPQFITKRQQYEDMQRRQAEAAVARYGREVVEKLKSELEERMRFTLWLMDSILSSSGRVPEHVMRETALRYPEFDEHIRRLVEEGKRDIDYITAFGIYSASLARAKYEFEVGKAAFYYLWHDPEYQLFGNWYSHSNRIHYGQDNRLIPPFEEWIAEFEAWKNQHKSNGTDLKSTMQVRRKIPLPPSLYPFSQNGLAPFASSPPAFGAVQAILAARKGWPTDEDGRPRYVVNMNGGKLQSKLVYYVILPWDATEDEVTIAHKELAWNILKSMGPDTAWLHMLLLAYAVDPTRRDNRTKRFVIPKEAVYHCLGLDKRSDLNREEKARRALEEIRKLRHLGLQIAHIQYTGKTKKIRRGKQTVEAEVVNWDRRLAALWELGINEFGQGLLFPLKNGDGKVLLTSTDWQLVGQEGPWGDIFLHGADSLRQFGYIARDMLEKIDRYRCPWGAALAVKLTFISRFNPGGTLKISNREIIMFAGGEEYPNDRKTRYSERLQVINAIEEQRKWGWEPDYSLWPEKLRPGGDADKADNLDEAPWDACPEQRLPPGYWDTFLQCETIFRPVKDSQPEKIAQANQQVKRLPETATLPALPKPGKAKKKTWVGSDIKELREKMGLTQRQLAAYLEVSPALVSHFETGRRKPNAHQKQKLAQLATGP